MYGRTKSVDYLPAVVPDYLSPGLGECQQERNRIGDPVFPMELEVILLFEW